MPHVVAATPKCDKAVCGRVPPDCAVHSAAGIIGFCMVDFLAVPAPAAIGAGGLLGAVAWAAKLN